VFELYFFLAVIHISFVLSMCSVLLPLSNFEITGTRRDQLPTGGFINVLEITLNINLNAQNLEELENSRKNACIEFGEELLTEIESSITESRVYRLPQHLDDIQRFRRKLLSKVESESPKHFNNPARFHDAIEEMFEARSMIMQEVEETIYDYCMHQVDTVRDFSFVDTDKDKSGDVNFEEFSAMYSNEGLSLSQLKAMFKSLDINKDGRLDRKEFSKIVTLHSELLTQEINMCVRLLSQKMANGSGDEFSGKMLSDLLLHTNRKDLGGLKALFTKHELEDLVDANGNHVNVCESVCYELGLKNAEDLSMVELKPSDVTFLEPTERGKLLRLISEAQSNSQEQAQFMTTKGDALSECHFNQSAFDPKFLLLERAIEAYEDAMKLRKRQTQENDQDLSNHAAGSGTAKELWTPQIASLQNKIGYLTQQRGKRYDGSFDRGKRSEAMSIFQRSLKLTNETIDALAETFSEVDKDLSGYIDFEEFSLLDTNHGLRESKLREIFDSLDVNSPRVDKKSPRRASLTKSRTMAEDYSLNTSGVSFSIECDDTSDFDPRRIEFDQFVKIKLDTLEEINKQLWKIEKREADEMWEEFIGILVYYYITIYYYILL
jgi:Ca2+-binding EF-hand superfamily protein